MVVSFPLFLTPWVFDEVTKVRNPRALNAVQTTARSPLPSLFKDTDMKRL